MRNKCHERRIAAGVCIHCEAPTEDSVQTCTPCRTRIRESQRARRAKLRESDTCITCGVNTQLPHGSMCRDCYCKNASAKNTGTRSNWEALLQKFYEQNQLCALTGEKLEMGFNTHVDHIMPVARFPELRDDVDNLQWTTAHVNFAKRNMTTQEFLELCKKVIACQTSE